MPEGPARDRIGLTGGTARHDPGAGSEYGFRVAVLSTGSEYPYGCPPAPCVGRLGRMTTHRAPKPVAGPTQTVERAVTIGLILAVLAGLGWIAGMIYTITEWPL
ncbi:hypothetical protein UK15_12410 [Streptomyces variegatus]|uniref:Uncharacterized protein n=1 Tax=Streptomyces variegatus TaxID=284040 RepID=A0A0M2GSY3_9ACTN|nr:hypothetical protein UK15_12410 [Streptomyces variegatus]